MGFDVLITDDFIPKLIEINFRPDLRIYNKLEQPIKYNLFIDTLNLIGIIPFSRVYDQPVDKKVKFNDNIKEKITNAFCEIQRPKGGYELIFPTKENIRDYKKYFLINYEENVKFWEKYFN